MLLLIWTPRDSDIMAVQIIGSADQDGCGMVAWWEQQEEPAGEAAMEYQS